jgi:hypothetical protein
MHIDSSATPAPVDNLHPACNILTTSSILPERLFLTGRVTSVAQKQYEILGVGDEW